MLFFMLLTIFPPIGGCDAPRKVAHRYGPIGGMSGSIAHFHLYPKEKRGAPLNGSKNGGASGGKYYLSLLFLTFPLYRRVGQTALCRLSLCADRRRGYF